MEFSAGDTARAETANPGFSDPYEALAWVLEQLPDMAGVSLDSDDTDRNEFAFTGPEGTTVTATLGRSTTGR